MSKPAKNLKRFVRKRMNPSFRRCNQAPADRPLSEAEPEPIGPEAIEKDIEYAFTCARMYKLIAEIINEGGVRGRSVLELGPGRNLGSIIILACFGARPIVADRFLTAWIDSYHPAFYQRLRQVCGEFDQAWVDLAPLETVLATNSHTEAVTCISEGAESLSGVDSDSVDIVYSNAVLEHIASLPAAIGELARVTKREGLGMHQVDFRDHRCLERPLEHLIMPPAEFAAMSHETNCECGSQYRPHEYREIFQQNGFEVFRFIPNLLAEGAYLDDFMLRLSSEEQSPYRDCPRSRLETISGTFVVKKVSDGGRLKDL